jgi:hypothetical protein
VKDYFFWFDMSGEHIAGIVVAARRIGYSGGFCSSGSPLREARATMPVNKFCPSCM